MTAPRILCVGALTMDTIFRMESLPTGPGKFIPIDAVEVAEGMAAAQAASIARLGGSALLWASRGDDATGERLVTQISGEGVDCSHVRVQEGCQSAISTIFMDSAGERTIVPYYDSALMAPPDKLPELDFSTLDAVMVDVRWPDAAEMALREAQRIGIPGILDADVASTDVLERLMPLASHVVASEPAAMGFTGAESAMDAVTELANWHSGFIAVTSGGEGCRWTNRKTNSLRHSHAVKVDAVDTLAAGDVFHAGFAVALTEGQDLEAVIRFASAAAAIKCTRQGGRLGCPTRAEMAGHGFPPKPS